jgi:hypothetical protein
MDGRDWTRAFAAAGLTAVLLSLVVFPAAAAGWWPFPEPTAQAFARKFLGDVPLVLPVLLHLAYVTFWGVVYVLVFRDRLAYSSAFVLGLVLWMLALTFFFPLVGWGLFGFGVGLWLIPGSLIPHLLFSILIWGSCRWFFRRG